MKQVMLYIFCVVSTFTMAQNTRKTEISEIKIVSSQTPTRSKSPQELADDTLSASSAEQNKMIVSPLSHSLGAKMHA